MEVKVSGEQARQVAVDLLVIPVPTGLRSSELSALAESTGTDLDGLASEEKFKGDVAATFICRGLPGIKARRVVLVGVGSEDDDAAQGHRRAGVAAARIARSVRARRVAVAAGSTDEQRVADFVLGFELGAYKYTKFLSKNEDTFDGTESLTVLHGAKDSKAIERARTVAAAILLGRDLVNDPPNEQVPETLAQLAKDLTSQYGFETKVFEESELHEKGFNLIMAVGKGSEHPPRLIHMIYRPDGAVKRKIALVGKGVTFDTGGYNLKPGGSLLNMHSDMGGAAAVFGAAKAIGELRPAGVEVHFIVPTVENSIAHNAFKPMDIFKGYGGKTVEIHNTDAEGRLILADALAYAQEQKPDTIIDLATLTGACVVALGEGTAALFTNDEKLATGLLDASKRTGESYWRMPLDAKMDKGLDTSAADMKNLGPRWGGAITAALFLKRWVDLDSWAHLDIAGPAWSEKEDELTGEGGTGFGVSTLVEYVTSAS